VPASTGEVPWQDGEDAVSLSGNDVTEHDDTAFSPSC
jgi:hypothetical protein